MSRPDNGDAIASAKVYVLAISAPAWKDPTAAWPARTRATGAMAIDSR
jgi:hypothetical protein